MGVCARCTGSRWICEAHRDRTWPHDGCSGPAGMPCPECEPQAPESVPALPDDWQTFLNRLSPRNPPSTHRERLFAFVRASDGAAMSCDLRFHGESYGWEALFYERGEMVYSHGGFAMRADAVKWAEAERDAMLAPPPWKND